MNQDAIINLILKTGDSQRTMDALSKSTANYKALIADLPGQLAAGKITTEEFVKKTADLSREHDKQARMLNQLTEAMQAQARAAEQEARATEDAAKAAHHLADAHDDVSKASHTLTGRQDSAAKATRNMGMAALEGGRMVQDFAQGGIGGIINNVERFTMAMGGSAGLAGIFTAVGVAALFATPELKKFAEAFNDALRGAIEKVPETTDRVKSLEARFKANAEALEELGQKQHLTNEEVGRYNLLAAEQIRLTKAQEEASKAAAARKAYDAISHPELKDVESRRAEQLTGSFGEAADRSALDVAVRGALPQDALNRAKAVFNAAKKALDDELANDPGNLVGMHEILQRQVDAAAKEVRRQSGALNQQAGDITAAAVTRGDTGAFNRILEMQRQNPNAFTPQARAAFQQGTEDALYSEERFQEEIERRKQAIKEREQARKEDERDDKALDRQAQKDAKRLAAIGPGRKEFNETERANAAAADKLDAFLDKSNREGQKSFRDQRDAAIKSLSEGSLDEQAALAAAQYRAQGGVMGRNGRVTKTDETGQLSALAEDLLQRLVVMIPNASDTMRKDVASHMAANAFSSVDEQVQAQQAQLLGGMNGNMNVAQKTQMTVAANQQALAAVLDRLRALEAQADAQLQQALDLRSQTRTAQRRGR